MFNSTFNKKFIKLSLIATSIAFLTSAKAADYYEVIDLGSVDSARSEAFAINDSNQVVGSANGDDFLNRAFVYQNSQSDFLNYLPYTFVVNEVTYEGHSFAFDINNSNFAVGVSREIITNAEDEDVTIDTAVVFDITNSTVVRIPQFLPDEPRDAKALAVNDNNLVVGYGNFNPDDDVDDDGNDIDRLLNRGFFYDSNSQVLTMINPNIDEETLPNVTLRGVNNSGYAVGVQAEIFSNGVILSKVVGVDVHSPDNVELIEIFAGTREQAWSINNQDIMVGGANSETDATIVQAFSYDIENDIITELGFLNDNFKYSEAYDINESNQVVGISQFQNSPNVFHAFLYENGDMRNLNDLIGCDTGWTLNEARSINDYDSGFNSGVITGTGLKDGEKRAFMLMPIAGTAPDCNADDTDDDSGSGSIPLTGLGLLAAIILFRRRQKNQ